MYVGRKKIFEKRYVKAHFDSSGETRYKKKCLGKVTLLCLKSQSTSMHHQSQVQQD